jgi:hypothetical protein
VCTVEAVVNCKILHEEHFDLGTTKYLHNKRLAVPPATKAGLPRFLLRNSASHAVCK